MASMTASIDASRPERPFFGILRRGYGYRNALYLLLSPLIAYFYVLLLIVIFGLQDGQLTLLAPVFILVCAWALSLVERGLAHALLGVSFTPMALIHLQ